MRTFAWTAYAVVAGIFALGGLLQVFLAGLGVFAGPTNFATHRDVGYTLSLLPLVLLILALVGRMPRRYAGLALLLGIQMVLQSVFVALRADVPTIAALHPVNGVLMIGIGSMVAIRSWRTRPSTKGAEVPDATTASPASAG